MRGADLIFLNPLLDLEALCTRFELHIQRSLTPHEKDEIIILQAKINTDFDILVAKISPDDDSDPKDDFLQDVRDLSRYVVLPFFATTCSGIVDNFSKHFSDVEQIRAYLKVTNGLSKLNTLFQSYRLPPATLPTQNNEVKRETAMVDQTQNNLLTQSETTSSNATAFIMYPSCLRAPYFALREKRIDDGIGTHNETNTAQAEVTPILVKQEPENPTGITPVAINQHRFLAPRPFSLLHSNLLFGYCFGKK
jgi:hypothetical protein